MSDIVNRKFADETGEFLLELSLCNISTTFDSELPETGGIHSLMRTFKLESSYLSFGGFEWNVSLVPALGEESTAGRMPTVSGSSNTSGTSSAVGGADDEESQPLSESTSINVFLNRLSGFENPVRVRYRLSLGRSFDYSFIFIF